LGGIACGSQKNFENGDKSLQPAVINGYSVLLRQRVTG
jgi:hypothetical protein